MDPRYPLVSLPVETGPKRTSSSWFMPPFEASNYDGLALLCVRPLHHSLEFSQLYRLLEELRGRAPSLAIHVWLRSALHDWDVLRTLPAAGVKELPSVEDQLAWVELRAQLKEGNWVCVGLDFPNGPVPLLSGHQIECLNGGSFSFSAASSESSAAAGASQRFFRRLCQEAPRWLGGPYPVAQPAAPRRFLVHQSRFRVGNALWLTPLLRSIARQFPTSQITVVGSGVSAKALEHNRSIAEFLEYSPEGGQAERVRLLEHLSSRSFDAAIFALVRRAKSRWLAEATAKMGIPVRINLEYIDGASDGLESSELFTHEGWFFWSALPSTEFLLHGLAPFLPREPAALRRLLQDRSVEFRVEGEWRREAAELLAREGIAKEPFVVLSPGGHSSDRWPPSHFAALATELGDRFGWHSLVNTGNGEECILEEILASVRRMKRSASSYQVVGAQTTLGVLAALIERAVVLVGNDSAPIHLAEAVDAPALYFAHHEKLTHSHPNSEFHWALYDASGNQPANISPDDAVKVLLEMIRVGRVRLDPTQPGSDT